MAIPSPDKQLRARRKNIAKALAATLCKRQLRREQGALEVARLVAAGETIRVLVNGKSAVCGRDAFYRYARDNPDWAANVKAMSKVNGFRKNADVSLRRSESQTHCANGHDLRMHGRLTIRPQGWRAVRCRECNRRKSLYGGVVTEDHIARFKAGLEAGLHLEDMTRDASSPRYVTHYPAFKKARKLDASLNEMFVDRNRYRINRTIGVVNTFDNSTYFDRCDGGDYQRIKSLIPAYIDGCDDIVQDIFLALLEGRVDRGNIAAYVRDFLTEQRRLFPTKFAKFGKASLVSLDAAAFDGSRSTRGDNVSQGLWS